MYEGYETPKLSRVIRCECLLALDRVRKSLMHCSSLYTPVNILYIDALRASLVSSEYGAEVPAGPTEEQQLELQELELQLAVAQETQNEEAAQALADAIFALEEEISGKI